MRGRCRAPQVDLPGELCGVVGGEQLRERRFDRARVGAPALTVGEGELFRLDHDMDRIGRQEAHARKIEMFEDFQLFEQYEAGRIGWRLDHRETAVVDADWFLLFGLEGFEIGGRYQTPRGLETGREPPRQAAAVEGIRAVRGDLFERAGEVDLDDQGAKRRRLTTG